MNKDIAAKLTIPSNITDQWLKQHFTNETIGAYRALSSCYSPQHGRTYLQEAINEGKVVESPTGAVLTPAAKKPKSIKSKVKKMLGMKGN